jgi:hypothetical protein
MHLKYIGPVACFVLSLALGAPAAAQTRVPDRGMGAISFLIGGAMPTEELLERGWFMAVAGEGYLTPRVSIRGQFGGSWHDVEFNGLDGKVSPMHLTGNLVYNWEYGKWHPYVTGGVGWYRWRFGEGDDRPTDSKIGANLGGGIEYFFTRRDTLMGDINIHFVPGTMDSNIFPYEGRYWTIAGGYKRYF